MSLLPALRRSEFPFNPYIHTRFGYGKPVNVIVAISFARTPSGRWSKYYHAYKAEDKTLEYVKNKCIETLPKLPVGYQWTEPSDYFDTSVRRNSSKEVHGQNLTNAKAAYVKTQSSEEKHFIAGWKGAEKAGEEGKSLSMEQILAKARKFKNDTEARRQSKIKSHDQRWVIVDISGHYSDMNLWNKTRGWVSHLSQATIYSNEEKDRTTLPHMAMWQRSA